MTELRETPFHRALHRSNLILGGDRELMIIAIMITAILTILSMNTLSFLSGVIFGIVSITCLRAMGKADPLMRQVYLRNIKYRSYYPAYSTPYRVAKTTGVY